MTTTVQSGFTNGGAFGPTPTTLLEAEARIRDLEAALATRHVIGVAQGMLMERRGLTLDSAFDVLIRVTQNTNLGWFPWRPAWWRPKPSPTRQPRGGGPRPVRSIPCGSSTRPHGLPAHQAAVSR
jgi:ANTAR domain